MDTTASDGYVNKITDGQGLTTISFYHQAQNSLPASLLLQLTQSIRVAGADPQTKVILLKSDGGHAFCAGASFDELLQIATKEQGFEFFSGFANVINACRQAPKLIIGRVHGKAIGGGAGIAAATDYCFATVEASVKLSELTIGIGPFVIGPALIRKIGVSAFNQLALNADQFYLPEWAKKNGLYDEIFTTAVEMDASIAVFASKLTAWNPEAISSLKRANWEGTDNWDTLLAERAAISGKLILSNFAQDAISKLKCKKK